MTVRDVIEDVLSNYDVGTLEAYEQIEGGFSNVNLKVVTSRGNYFLKEHKKSDDLEKIRQVNDVLVQLRADRFPVAAPIFTKSGQTVCAVSGSAFTLYEWVEGKSYDFSPEQIVNSAKTLASLHKKVIDLPAESDLQLDIQDTWMIKSVFEGSESAKSKLKSKINKTNVDKMLLRQIPRIEHHFTLLKRDLPYVRDSANKSLLHGDFWHGQLVFQEHEVAALIDFEHMRIGRPEYDLVKGVRSFPRHKHKVDYNLDQLKAFLLAYKSVYGEIDIEPREVLAYLRKALLEICAYFVRDWGLKNQSGETGKMLKYHLDELDWIENHEDEIVTAFIDPES